MIKACLDFNGIGLEKLGAKFMNMGCDQNNVFQGHQRWYDVVVQRKSYSFFIGIHYFAHKTNLAMVDVSKLHLVCWLEGILQALYVFLVHNLKKNLEFHKLAKLIGTIGNKLFKNVKTYWIFMFSPTKHVFVKYRPLIVKMHAKSSRNDAKDYLCDVEPILKFPCILSMLECVHALIKITQNKDSRLCVILWSLSNWFNKSYTNFIVILMPSMRIWQFHEFNSI